MDGSALTLVAHAALGVGLAACAGLRAFLPLFALGLAGRWGVVTLSPGFDWIAQTPALVAFGVAVVVEILADKVPLLDHGLDLLGTVIKPAAGGLIAGSALAHWTPFELTVLWIIAGGALSGIVHLGKAGLRGVSTTVSGGLGNPVLSFAEDGLALAGTLLSLVVPLVALSALALGLGLVWLTRRRARVRAST